MLFIRSEGKKRALNVKDAIKVDDKLYNYF